MIAVFLDDGICVEYNKVIAEKYSHKVKSTLHKAGFLLNTEKSVWVPVKNLDWLGLTLDMKLGTLKITEKRISNITSKINNILNNTYLSARDLAKLTGMILSTKFVIGHIVQLKTRFLYKAIEDQYSWDKKFNINFYHEAIREVIFWKTNIVAQNKKHIRSYSIPELKVYSDASNTGMGATFMSQQKTYEAYKNFSTSESSQSSTWRELKAIQFSLNSFAKVIHGKSILWHTDNIATAIIIKNGSNKIHLQNIALEIFDTVKANNILLDVTWISRKFNESADTLSKTIDYDDWIVTNKCFQFLNKIWGPVTIDRFADNENKKTYRFNSRYYCENTEAVEALSTDWSNETNWLVPPVYLIAKCVKHFLLSETDTRGILIVPFWESATFWPLIINNDRTFKSFVKDFKFLNNSVRLGNYKGSIIGSSDFHTPMLALLIIV